MAAFCSQVYLDEFYGALFVVNQSESRARIPIVNDAETFLHLAELGERMASLEKNKSFFGLFLFAAHITFQLRRQDILGQNLATLGSVESTAAQAPEPAGGSRQGASEHAGRNPNCVINKHACPMKRAGLIFNLNLFVQSEQTRSGSVITEDPDHRLFLFPKIEKFSKSGNRTCAIFSSVYVPCFETD